MVSDSRQLMEINSSESGFSGMKEAVEFTKEVR